MAAGLTERVWDMEELVKLIDEVQAPAPQSLRHYRRFAAGSPPSAKYLRYVRSISPRSTRAPSA